MVGNPVDHELGCSVDLKEAQGGVIKGASEVEASAAHTALGESGFGFDRIEEASDELWWG